MKGEAVGVKRKKKIKTSEKDIIALNSKTSKNTRKNQKRPSKMLDARQFIAVRKAVGLGFWPTTGLW
jgi:hypothetical protein